MKKGDMTSSPTSAASATAFSNTHKNSELFCKPSMMSLYLLKKLTQMSQICPEEQIGVKEQRVAEKASISGQFKVQARYGFIVSLSATDRTPLSRRLINLKSEALGKSACQASGLKRPHKLDSLHHPTKLPNGSSTRRFLPTEKIRLFSIS